jgi:hypothetical protein
MLEKLEILKNKLTCFKCMQIGLKQDWHYLPYAQDLIYLDLVYGPFDPEKIKKYIRREEIKKYIRRFVLLLILAIVLYKYRYNV